MLWIVIIFAHVAGAILSVDAVMKNRTAQGAIAWAVSLNTFPYVVVPIYLVFGRQRFQGWIELRQEYERDIEALVGEIEPKLAPFAVDFEQRIPNYEGLKGLSGMPFLRGNDVELLVDGEATFESILEGIRRAEDYVLVEFYIVRSDDLGNRLKDALIERSRAGVEVLFIFDALGSRGLSRIYHDDLRQAGVQFSPFNSTLGRRNRFQLNFRNHRKIVVVDGKVAWVGGHNVGDEYLGLDPKIGPWRDTHVRIHGPAVLMVQATFLMDWLWAKRDVPSVSWDPDVSTSEDIPVMILSTGPADEPEKAQLFFVHALNAAQDRIWIATPYFVPDQAVSAALRMAALRGVDVRVIVPSESDNLLVDLASLWFIQDLDGVGIHFFRYQEGFMHQKVLLVDRLLAKVGSANFDNRSFRLQFEANALIANEAFAGEVEAMLQADFNRSEEFDPSDLKSRSFFYRLAVHAARLMAPLA